MRATSGKEGAPKWQRLLLLCLSCRTRGSRKELGRGGFGVGRTREEYEESRKRLGIREEKVWVQRTPIEASIIVYWETDDPQRTLREIADSQDEFGKNFGGS